MFIYRMGCSSYTGLYFVYVIRWSYTVWGVSIWDGVLVYEMGS